MMLVAAAAVLAGPAAARTPATLAFSSYLRAAPNVASAVLDEVEHDRTAEVLGDVNGWKRVRWSGREGYVDAAAFAPAPARAPGGPACVAARWADDTARPVTRLCGPAPAAPASGR